MKAGGQIVSAALLAVTLANPGAAEDRSGVVDTFRSACMSHLGDFDASAEALEALGFIPSQSRASPSIEESFQALSARNARLVRSDDSQQAIVSVMIDGLAGDAARPVVQCSVMSEASDPVRYSAALLEAIQSNWPNAPIFSDELDRDHDFAPLTQNFYIRLGSPSDRPLHINLISGPGPEGHDVLVLALGASRSLPGDLQ